MRNELTAEVMAHKGVTCGVWQFTSLLMLKYHNSPASWYHVEWKQLCTSKTRESLDETNVFS